MELGGGGRGHQNDKEKEKDRMGDQNYVEESASEEDVPVVRISVFDSCHSSCPPP